MAKLIVLMRPFFPQLSRAVDRVEGKFAASGRIILASSVKTPAAGPHRSASAKATLQIEVRPRFGRLAAGRKPGNQGPTPIFAVRWEP
jgi:hypothetical protein